MTTPDLEQGEATFQAHPLTPDRWADLELLFGPHGAYSGCWCMWWRVAGKDWSAQRGEGNRAAFKDVVDSGEVPGIIGYLDGEPAAWCAIAPRDAHMRLAKSASASSSGWTTSRFGPSPASTLPAATDIRGSC